MIRLVSIDRPHRARDEGQRLQGLHDAQIIGGVDDRIGGVGDEIQTIRRHSLAVQLGEVGQHPAAEPEARKSPSRRFVDCFKRRAFRPF